MNSFNKYLLQAVFPSFTVSLLIHFPWRRERLPTPVFLHGEFHGQRSLVGHGPWVGRVSHDLATNSFTFMYTYIYR